MAGYSKIYFIGGKGGFLGADGINPIALQIWQGEGNRQWLEAHYFDNKLSPIGNINTIIPEGPDHPNALIDACIAFAPKLFKGCKSLPKVAEKLQNETRLDFDIRRDDILKEWEQLREEAREIYENLVIYVAELKPLIK
ncbi:hypothetical protein SAMN02745883_02384 [Caminicella sporogenes DSM 14501]|uniref:Uncharacterized protein n=1 Tax=Caminicella sporogenes DSM 14501 TaxID=1121266 RepID=A0A1M6TL79_9FIRM|nr:hypothetical protein [Caminicella sporogenes]RKD22341.1 hypothetical protein BET04_04725 [Caminicella sporogenes]SHK57822.1 hypothetical protein SAMN02745883_02384 [Caminicella sporogenes DSM 14501]